MDLNKIKGQRRAALIDSGARFGSPTINAQIDLTLSALPDHQDVLKRYGLADKDATELVWLRAESTTLLQDRPEVAREASEARKVTQTRFASLKRLRLRGRDVLSASVEGAQDELDEEALLGVRQVIERTARAGDDAALLAQQVRQLADALDHAELIDEVNERGGAGLAQELRDGALALEQANQSSQRPLGTPAETALLDLMDGLALERLRRIRRAARRAAAEEGKPEIAKLFELSHLK